MAKSKTNWRHWRLAFGIAIPMIMVAAPIIGIVCSKKNSWDLKCVKTTTRKDDVNIYVYAESSKNCYWCGDKDDWTALQQYTVDWDFLGPNKQHSLYFCLKRDHSDKKLVWDQVGSEGAII